MGSSVWLTVRGANGVRDMELLDTSEEEAVRQAAKQGLEVLAVCGIRASATVEKPSRDKFPLLLFTQELLALLEAGLNLMEALATLHAKERRPLVKSVLNDVLVALRQGRNFSDALAALPSHFPEVYIATIRASEHTGDLPRSLARYIAYQLQFEAIRKKLISASIYPAMLLVVGGFVLLFLLGYVIPRFAKVYESTGHDLPWLSSVLLGFGGVLNTHWQICLGIFGVVMGTIGFALSRPQGRTAVLSAIMGLPWFVEKTQQFRLARFYRALSLLLAAGIALPRAIGMVAGLLDVQQQQRLSGARLAVEQGLTFSAALGAAQLSDPVADSLIKVGERSGMLAEMLERTANFQDEDFARWIDWTSRLLEPILMTAIGLVVGTVVVLMYIPIFDLAGSIQ